MSPPSETRERLTLVDVLRLVASVTVVHHHVRDAHLFGIGLGLPLFLLLLFGLNSCGSEREPLGRFARRKARFLLVPWLRWSAVYVALLVASDAASGQGAFRRLEPEMLVYGGVPSLWFLPFAAVAVVAVKLLQRASARLPEPAAIAGAALLAALATRFVPGWTQEDLTGLPFDVWARASPAISWGLALGLSLSARPRARRRAWLAGVGALALLTSALATDTGDSLAERYAFAVPLVCIAFAWSPRVPGRRALSALASLCFGIYLVHPLADKAIGSTFDALAWPAVLHTGTVWVLSAALVLALRRSGLRWAECAVPQRPVLVEGEVPARAGEDSTGRARSKAA